MSKKTREYDLENRLINFAVSIIDIVEALPNTRAAKHIAGQLVRSGTSPAPNYGEAQSAESRKDFIHKLSIVLKELRETEICLKIINRSKSSNDSASASQLISECRQLVAIFQKSINTAKTNNKKMKPPI